MKFSTILLAALTGVSAFAAPPKDTNPWLIRVRALDMVPLNHSRAFTALATDFPANSIHLNSKLFPEVDISYFFNKNWAAELVLTYPQRHTVHLDGVGDIGHISHLPPTLTLQYHYPIEKCPVTPYIGVGINYTMISDIDLKVGATPLTVTKNSFGLAYGLGFDYKIDDHWSLNLDYKHVNITTNVKAGSTILTNLDVNPNLFSIGIGYKF